MGWGGEGGSALISSEYEAILVIILCWGMGWSDIDTNERPRMKVPKPIQPGSADEAIIQASVSLCCGYDLGCFMFYLELLKSVSSIMCQGSDHRSLAVTNTRPDFSVGCSRPSLP